MDESCEGIELQNFKRLDSTGEAVNPTGHDQQEDKTDVEDIDVPLSPAAVNTEGIEETEDNINDDEVDLLSPADVDIKMAPKMLRLQFPRIDEVQSSDVADVMRRKLERLNSKATINDKGPVDAFTVIYQSGLARQISWQAQVEEAVKDESDEFWRKTAEKTQQHNLNRTDAIFEVYTDRIVEKTRSCDRGLLWIVSQDISEFSAELFVSRLLDRGANTSAADQNLNTSLHHTARKGWTSITKKLLEHQSLPLATNRQGSIPLELAVINDHDECATFLVKSIEPERVRQLFQGNEDSPCKLKFHALLDKPHMKTTVLAILDTMMQPLEGEPNTYIVYYHILDGDQNGCAPNCRTFDSSEKSCLHKIAKSNNKEVVYHDAVRLLLKRKWKKFARFRFLNQFLFFLFHTGVMTLALILAARENDPSNYDDGVDIFRGICEAVLICCILYNVIVEIYQIKKHKWYYFADYFNYLDLGAVVFPLLIIPFRIPNFSVQWVFASLGYLCQTLRGFKYAAVFRSTGAYVQILIKILVQDMVPFSAIFGLFLFSFTGAFYFALRGEEFTDRTLTSTNCSSFDDGAENCVTNFTTTESSSLDIHSHLTMEYYHVLFTYLRVMIEAEDIIDEYFGPQGYEWLSVIIYVVFLFLVITVLLNLLIAQMSDTYSNVQSDAQRSLVINRAWIVARVEHNTLLAFDYRRRNYRSCEIVRNPHEQLDKWEAPPLNQVSKELEKIQKLMKQQEDASNEFRQNVMQVLAEQQKLIQQLLTKNEERQ
ncbi:transient receptor potential cation channel subfamily A member 1-like isoform X2 [Dysidea avara]|uniref:transient receptor potential cation channel subfamily A member 1-like isoform X2 n=1 Tax=Dysidea avara TaxID=196820 RepID=UPI003327331C